MCVQIDGVTISAKSEVQLNGQGFIQVGNCKTSPNVNLYFFDTLGQNHFQVSNMNASTTFSDVEMQINDCMFCPNGEVIFKALLINPTKCQTSSKTKTKTASRRSKLSSIQLELESGTRLSDSLSTFFSRCLSHQIFSRLQCSMISPRFQT